MKIIKKIGCIIIGCVLCVLMWIFCERKQENGIYNEIKSGNFTSLKQNEIVDLEEIKRIYGIQNTHNNVVWKQVDLNDDGNYELIWEDGNSNEDLPKRIVGIFAQHEIVECVFWDVNDSTDYFFLGAEGNIVHYTQYMGIYGFYSFQNYIFDQEWNMQMLYGLSVYNIYDVSEIEEWKYKYPEMSADGIYYRKFEGYEKESEEITEREFNYLYKQMTGDDFKLSNFI